MSCEFLSQTSWLRLKSQASKILLAHPWNLSLSSVDWSINRIAMEARCCRREWCRQTFWVQHLTVKIWKTAPQAHCNQTEGHWRSRSAGVAYTQRTSPWAISMKQTQESWLEMRRIQELSWQMEALMCRCANQFSTACSNLEKIASKMTLCSHLKRCAFTSTWQVFRSIQWTLLIFWRRHAHLSHGRAQTQVHNWMRERGINSQISIKTFSCNVFKTSLYLEWVRLFSKQLLLIAPKSASQIFLSKLALFESQSP